MGVPERVRTETREEVTYQTKKKNRTGSSESSETLLSPRKET